MKAVLVIDIPNCCAECPLMLWDAESEYYGACCPTLKEVNCVADSYKENENKGTKPNWCPLKPLPKRMEVEKYIALDTLNESTAHTDIISLGVGWNACLEEIENA